MLMTSRQWEVIFWSIALPGFGQFLNKAYLKGVVILFLEVLINANANLNTAIIASFLGDIPLAIAQTNYEWLMFYPCVYLFAIWDAYRDSGGGTLPFSFLTFVSSAFLGTIGIIYSTIFRIGNVLLGPIWLPIICLIVGAGVGFIIKNLLLYILNLSRSNNI
jgi:hypothetical protein